MSRLNKLLKGHGSMTFRLAFGASYSTIVFTVKILLIYEVEWNPQSPTTHVSPQILKIAIRGSYEAALRKGVTTALCNNTQRSSRELIRHGNIRNNYVNYV